eukprot:scaffold3505_cov98-Cylindrotheca_fusiformis.AAC.1
MKFLSWLPTMAVVMTTTLLIQQPAVMVNGFPSPRLISNATKSRLMMPLRVDHALGLVPKDSDGDKAPAPRGVALNTFVGGLTFAGGAMGFATKGSKASLIAGSTFGGMLLISALLISKQKGRSGNVMGSVVSALLTFVMGKKFLASKKFMPAGLIASLGTIAVIYNTIEAFFTRQAATPKEEKEE